MNEVTKVSDIDFVEYLNELSKDLCKSGSDATAKDFEDASNRIARANKVMDLLWDVLRDRNFTADACVRQAMDILRSTKDHT